MAAANQSQYSGGTQSGNLIALSVVTVAIVLAGLIYLMMTHTTSSTMGNVETSAMTKETPANADKPVSKE